MQIFAFAVAVMLLALVVVFMVIGASQGRSVEDESEYSHEPGMALEVCTAALIDQIFSDTDRQYVRSLKSRSLERQFEQERKGLALLWVRQTAAAIRCVMRTHAQSSRQSADLHVTTEVLLLVHYAELMLLCGALIVLIQIAGPLRLRSLALYANRLLVRITNAQQIFTASVGPHAASVEGSSGK